MSKNPAGNMGANPKSYRRSVADTQLFTVAAAARLAGLHPQTLRSYDRLGLVQPLRTTGGSRRYSMHHVEALRQVTELALVGINREGIRRILNLSSEVAQLRGQLQEVSRQLEEERSRRPGQRVFAADSAGDQVVTVTRGTRVRYSKNLVLLHRSYR